MNSAEQCVDQIHPMSYCLDGFCVLYKLEFNSFYRFAFHLLFEFLADFNMTLRNKNL